MDEVGLKEEEVEEEEEGHWQEDTKEEIVKENNNKSKKRRGKSTNELQNNVCGDEREWGRWKKRKTNKRVSGGLRWINLAGENKREENVLSVGK